MEDIEKKYWIKSGVYVRHDDLPGIKITVDEIERTHKNEMGKKLVKGVRCHWIVDGKQQVGLFRTTEIKPW